MGTVVTFDLFDPRGFDDRALGEAFERASAVLHEVDDLFSTWKPQSPMSRLRRGELDATLVPAQITDVLERCQEIKSMTGGWFDPWAMPGGVDPTGFVKGWAAQRSLDVLASLGARGSIVNAAGDVCVSGRALDGAEFRVGIVNPFNRRALAGVVRATSAVATSGDYERGSHLVNPFSGEAASSLASATVCGPDLGVADALATALVVGGRDVLDFVGAFETYEALVIGRDREWVATTNFPLVSGLSLS